MKQIKSSILATLLFFPSFNYAQSSPIYNDSIEVINLEAIEIISKKPRVYNIGDISSSLRLNSKILDIPQNIQSVSSTILKDQFVFSVNEGVTRNVSGTFREELHNGISSDIYSRGGYINAQRNGVDLRPLLKGPLADDVSVIERIEFVKGPSVFMNSLGDPAGSYNIVTKKADGIERNYFTLSQGSFNMFRGEADLSGKYDKTNKLFYRVNLAGMSKHGFLKYDDNSKLLIAPSIRYNIDNNTSISAQYIYQHMNFKMLSEAQISPYGFGTLPKDFTITDPSTRPYTGDEHNAYLNFDKKLNEKWSFHTQFANINSKSEGTMYWVNGKNEQNPDILDRVLVYDAMKYNTFSAQGYAQGKFNTGIFSHSLLTGVDYNFKTNKTQDTWNTATTIYPLSISNPVYTDVINNNGIGGNSNSENQVNGVENNTNGRLYYISPYIMDEIGIIDNLITLNVGLRYTKSEARMNQYGDITKASDSKLSPRAGLNVKVDRKTGVYVLYDNTFTPIAGKSYDGKNLKPIKGESIEIGLKREWTNDFSTTISAYHITRSNTAINDPATNDIYQTGQNKAKGFEIDVKGRVFHGMYVNINYAYTDSKITKDDKNESLVGRATPNRIRHIQNTWVTYQIPSKLLNGLSVSTGYQLLMGRAERFTSSEPATLKNIFRMDSGVSYERGKITLQVMVNNVLNTKQYSTVWKKNDMYYWVQLAPVNYRCSLTIKI